MCVCACVRASVCVCTCTCALTREIDCICLSENFFQTRDAFRYSTSVKIVFVHMCDSCICVMSGVHLSGLLAVLHGKNS